MNEINSDSLSAAPETTSPKREWQTPAMEVFDVSTVTLASPSGVYISDFGTYHS